MAACSLPAATPSRIPMLGTLQTDSLWGGLPSLQQEILLSPELHCSASDHSHKAPLWFAKDPGLWSPESGGDIPESRRPFPEATQKPNVPSGERCSCSWLVPSGNTSTTRPTVRAKLGAPTSSTLRARRGGALVILQGRQAHSEDEKGWARGPSHSLA